MDRVSSTVCAKTSIFDNDHDFDYKYDFWYDQIHNMSSPNRFQVSSRGRPPVYYENC